MEDRPCFNEKENLSSSSGERHNQNHQLTALRSISVLFISSERKFHVLGGTRKRSAVFQFEFPFSPNRLVFLAFSTPYSRFDDWCILVSNHFVQ